MANYSKNFLTSMTGFMNLDSGDKPANVSQEDFYKASAKLSYYKDILNDKLKQKNPEAFKEYFKGLVELRKQGKSSESQKYIQDQAYNEFLSPSEVSDILGEENYSRYLQSVKTVNNFNVQQGKQPLYGTIEGENDLAKLNYGRRFASLQITPSLSVFNQSTGKKYERAYQYNPSNDLITFTESGDISLKPTYLSK
jgi:hypothetical protein